MTIRRNVDSIWAELERAGLLELPTNVPRDFITIHSVTTIIEMRVGNSYRASSIDCPGPPLVRADSIVHRLDSIIISGGRPTRWLSCTHSFTDDTKYPGILVVLASEPQEKPEDMLKTFFFERRSPGYRFSRGVVHYRPVRTTDGDAAWYLTVREQANRDSVRVVLGGHPLVKRIVDTVFVPTDSSARLRPSWGPKPAGKLRQQ